MKIIQIGAHYGKDHVFEYACNNKDTIKSLILIEANPKCIPILRDCYKDFDVVAIYNFAVTTTDEDTLELWTPDNEDTSSHVSQSRQHLLAHGHSHPIMFSIPAKNINDIFEQFTDGYIDRFYIDVEGYDVDVLNQIDFSKIEIAYIYFEYIHSDGTRSGGGEKLERCKDKLINLGYKLSTEEYNIIAYR